MVEIDGDQYDFIKYKGNKLVLGEKKLIKLAQILQRKITDEILIELTMLNELMRTNNVKIMDIGNNTMRYISGNLGHLIFNKYDYRKYDHVIEEFKNNLRDGISEKLWQDFIHTYADMLFPEYISVKREVVINRFIENEGQNNQKRIVDFLFKNDSKHLLLEIKLPQNPILSKNKDRNNYYLTSGTTKSVLQLYNYLYEYKQGEGRNKYVKGILLAGNLKPTKINENHWNLTRDMYKDIEIMTYNELLQKLVKLRNLIKDEQL